jgi:hypothetical protein
MKKNGRRTKIVTAVPTKLYEAFEKIRLGKVEEGMRQFDRVDGFDTVKAIALAELSYFRHDWKHGIQFAKDFLISDVVLDSSRYNSAVTVLHLQLFLIATCQLACWKESRNFLEQLKKTEAERPVKNSYYIQKTIEMISDTQNTARKLLESRPKLRTDGKDDLLENCERWIRSKQHQKRIWRDYDDMIAELYRKAKTEDHIFFYEKYFDNFVRAINHAHAAKSYIAMNNISEAKKAIKRYMSYWKFKDTHQVAPIVLFTEQELWAVMSDKHFTESLLTIPHNNES